jgi:putative IMPACT (imprinted ancient) family translation regulator
VRYYGGTNLGTGGLARAYRLAAERAIAAGGFEVVYDTVTLEVRCPYEKSGVVRRLLDPPHVRLASERFDPEPVLTLEVRRSRVAALAARLEEARLAFAVS